MRRVEEEKARKCERGKKEDDPKKWQKNQKRKDKGYSIYRTNKLLKFPKSEPLHRTDFFYFYTKKPLWPPKIKNSKF